MKITAGIVLRNEAPLLEACVLSISPYVDEILIVEDSSVDGSQNIAKRIEKINNKVKVYTQGPQNRLADARNWIDDNASGDWIVWWDADFVALGDEDGAQFPFSRLMENIAKLKSENQVLYGGRNIGPTRFHTLRSKPYQGSTGDTQITRKGLMRFYVDKFIDTRRYTAERKTLYLNNPSTPSSFVHLDKLKPISRMILRDLLYKFEVEFPYIESTPRNFKLWLFETNPDFNLQGAITYTLRKMTGDILELTDFILPRVLEDHVSLNWYKMKNGQLEYDAPTSVDAPYMVYFDVNA